MRNKLKVAKQESLKIVLNVVIIFLVLVLLIMIMVTVNSLKAAFSVHFKEDSFSYDIGHKDFGGLVYKYYTNKGVDYQGNSEMQEYYGVARYYEAAFLYKAYETIGDEEKALQFRNKMKQTEKDMGDWGMVKDSIHDSLGIEE